MAKRYYKDTPLNRKLNRVGNEITKASAVKKQAPKKSDDDPIYDKQGRKDRSRVKSSKYVDSEDDDSNPMPKKTPKKKAAITSQPKKKAARPKPPSYDEITKKEKKKTTNTPQYQRLLDRTKARKEKEKEKKKKPPTKKVVSAASKKLPGLRDSEQKYNDEYSKQLMNKRQLNKELKEKGSVYRKARKEFGKDDPKRPPPKPPRGVPRKKKMPKKKEAPDAFAGLKDSDFDEFFEKPKKPTKPKPKKAPQKAIVIPPKKREIKKPIRTVKKESLDEMIERKFDEHKNAKPPISLVGKKDIPTRNVSYKDLVGGMDRKYQDSGRLFPSNYLGAYVPQTEFNLTTVGNNLDDRLIAVQEAVADMDREGTAVANNRRKLDEFARRGYSPKAYADLYETNKYKKKAPPRLDLSITTPFKGPQTPPGPAYIPNPENMTEEQRRITLNYVPQTPSDKDIRAANTPKPLPKLVSIGGGVKKEVRVAGRPAPVDASGFIPPRFKTFSFGVQDIDLAQDLRDKELLYSGPGGDMIKGKYVPGKAEGTPKTQKQIEKEIEKKEEETKSSFTDKQLRSQAQDTRNRAPGKSKFIKNTKADYGTATAKGKGLYKDRKEALIQGLLAGGNERTLPVRNPRYFKGNKKGDAEFVREGEQITQVKQGVKYKTRDRGDGILPKKDAKIPPKPKQPQTNKAFLAGRKLKDLSAADKKAYEKVKKANQRYNKKLLEWTTKYGNIPAPRLKVPPSSAFLTKGTPRVIDKYEEKGTAIFRGGEGITSIKHTSNYEKGIVKDAMKKAGIPSKTTLPDRASQWAEFRKRINPVKASPTLTEKLQKKKDKKKLTVLGYTDRFEEARALDKEFGYAEVPSAKLKLLKSSTQIIPKETAKYSEKSERIIKSAANIGTKYVSTLEDDDQEEGGADASYDVRGQKVPDIEPRTQKKLNKYLENVKGGRIGESKKLDTSIQGNLGTYRRQLLDKGTVSVLGAREDLGLEYSESLQAPTKEDKVQVANMIQEALEAKGKNDAKYQKIRQSDAEFQRREGQERALEVLARKGNKRAIGVKSNQDVASRLAKIEKDNYKPSNVASNFYTKKTTVDTRYFNVAQDWEQGESYNQDIQNPNDNLGDADYAQGDFWGLDAPTKE